jgi:DNA-binding transcriptional MerR regulator
VGAVRHTQEVTVDALLPIGRFAQLSRLSVKSLRHYDEIGLLPPAHVDPRSGYRSYAPEQARTAQVIALLRAVDVPLAEIADVVRDGRPSTVRAVLGRHRDRLLDRLGSAERMLATVERLLEEGTVMPYDITVRELAPERVLRIRLTTRMDELGRVTGPALEEVAKELAEQGVAPSGPAFLICPLPGEDGRVDIEAGWPVAAQVRAGGRAEPGELPGGRAAVTEHVGPYDQVEPVYRALTDWMTAHGEQPSSAPIERYLTTPSAGLDPSAYRTEIAWPLR